VIWEPFLLAVAFGLVVSAGIYFAVMWPRVEPEDVPDEPEPPPPDDGDRPPFPTD